MIIIRRDNPREFIAYDQVTEIGSFGRTKEDVINGLDSLRKEKLKKGDDGKD